MTEIDKKYSLIYEIKFSGWSVTTQKLSSIPVQTQLRSSQLALENPPTTSTSVSAEASTFHPPSYTKIELI